MSGDGLGFDAWSVYEERYTALLLPDGAAVAEGAMLAEGFAVIGDEEVQAVIGIAAALQNLQPALKAQIQVRRAAAVEILEGLDLVRAGPGRGHAPLHVLGHRHQTGDHGVLVLGEGVVLGQARARFRAHVVGSVHGVGVHEEEQRPAVVPVQEVLGTLEGVRQA